MPENGADYLCNPTQDLDLVLFFATQPERAESALAEAPGVNEAGGRRVWVAYPKKSSGIESDLTGMQEWDVTKGSDWNPVTMIGVDETWSAVRFKYAPGLEKVRHDRQEEQIKDADGMVVVDREKRVVTAPKDLQKLLRKSAGARATFDGLSFTNRKEYVLWIVEAKKPETRDARLTKTVEMLALGKKWV